MSEFKDSVTSIDVSDHEILAGSADGRVRRYDLRMGELFADFIGSKYEYVEELHSLRQYTCTRFSVIMIA